MTNNVRTITAKAAYNTIIEETYYIARWQYEKSERTIYFKLIKDLDRNLYYKLRENTTNAEKFKEIFDYLTEVYTDVEIEEDE